MDLRKERKAEIQNTIEELSERLFENNGLAADELEAFQKIVEEIGWPKISVVGKKTAAEAWSIAIETIKPNSAFHKKCLELMKNCEESTYHESYISEFEALIGND